MSRSIEQLKNEARREEQRENWTRAIQLYGEAIRKSRERGEVATDLSLYNRIGDLHRRQGDREEAVRHYMMAVDDYADQGLHTGAVALCNKILRIDPGQVEVYRKLARLHVATGLVVEARRAIEEYGSRMTEAGEEERRLDAYLEFARLAEDEELHLACVDELVERGLRAQAADELAVVWERRQAAGEPADDLEQRILELDPDAGLHPAGEPEPEGTQGATVQEPLEELAPDREEEPPERPSGAAAPPGGSGEEEAKEEVPPRGPEEPERVDLGERIRSRLGQEETGGSEEVSRGATGYDFDGMLVGFRARVAETVGEADPEAHVELGVALRQMGLVEDAIREFQLALRAPDPPLRAFELLGECFVDQALHSVAVRVLRRGSRLPGREDHELLGILYQLGVALQEMGEEEQALDCFERVYSVDIDFRDVAGRMEAVSA